jgi:hypothetical protein
MRARGGDGGDGAREGKPDSGSRLGPVRGRMKGLTGGPRLSAREGEKEGEGAHRWWAEQRLVGRVRGKRRGGERKEMGRAKRLGCAMEEEKRKGEGERGHGPGRAGEGKEGEGREKKRGRWAGPREKERERKKGKIANSNAFEL